MSKYALVKNGVVQAIINGEASDYPDIAGSLVSCSDEVSDNYSYDGSVFSAPAAPQLPDVTPRQIRLALITSGISLATIDSTIDSLPEPTKSVARIEWEYSIAFQRSRPLVIALGAMLGLNSSQLDDLWKLAASL